MVTEIELFKFPDLILLDFCLWGWMKSEVYTRRVDTWLGHVFGAAVCIKEREDQLRLATRYLRRRVSMCFEVDGVFEHLL
jgi:hypothetical protein